LRPEAEGGGLAPVTITINAKVIDERVVAELMRRLQRLEVLRGRRLEIRKRKEK